MKVSVALAALVAGSTLLGAPATHARESAKLVVSPARALVDEPVDVRVTGLRPRRKVTLVASARDRLGKGWRSRLVFTADRRGAVGTHSNMKLFWSMRPTKPSEPPAPFAFSHGDMPVLIRAQVGGHTVASGTLVRRAEAPDLKATEATVAVQGFAGTYYARPTGAPAPAILALGGSGGGHGGGGLLASHGYPTLSLGYYKEPGLPQELRRIPLEYFRTALRWLAAQPGVDPRRIVVLGVSRGGEAALLASAMFPDLVHGAISCTGSADVQGSVPEGDAAWTLNGTPVPAGTPIAVERTAGPVLAFFGGKDGFGDPTLSERELVARARAHGRRDIVVHVYPNAGHGVGCVVPNVPLVGQMEYAVAPSTYVNRGGTLAANEQAAAAASSLVLRFLRTLPG